MTSLMTKTLTGAALAAAITLGGITSAYAQYIQPYNEPFSDEPVIENVATNEDESLVGLKPGLWIYNGDRMTVGHEWVGLAGGTLVVSGLYHNFWDIYHKGGSISCRSFDMDIDRLWVTLDTLGDSDPFKSNRDGALDIGTFILQVGETKVHGETFGVKKADKKLVLAPGKNNRDFNKDITTITYDGKKFNPLGVKGGTEVMVQNYSGGIISDIEVQSGSLANSGQINNATQTGGNARNEGYIDNFVMSGPDSQFTNDGSITFFTMSDGGELTTTSKSEIKYAKFTASPYTTEWGYPIESQAFHNYGFIRILEADAASTCVRTTYCGNVMNCPGGRIGEAYLYGRTDFWNESNASVGTVWLMESSSRFVNEGCASSVSLGCGRVENSGTIRSLTLSNSGILNNAKGRIDTLFIHKNRGTIEALGDVGEIIYCDYLADAGADEGVIDESYVDEGFSDNAVMDNADWDDADFDDTAVDNAGWQDAAPLGEEVMVW